MCLLISDSSTISWKSELWLAQTVVAPQPSKFTAEARTGRVQLTTPERMSHKPVRSGRRVDPSPHPQALGETIRYFITHLNLSSPHPAMGVAVGEKL